MRTLKEVMGGYLEDVVPLNEIAMQAPQLHNDCPISPSPSQWETVTDPTRFMKKFEFQDFSSFRNFLDEVLMYQEQIQHHAKITIEHLSVIIEVYTHDVNTVTELDQEYVHEIENILGDIQHYNKEDDVYVGR